jgi:hypothetical protein
MKVISKEERVSCRPEISAGSGCSEIVRNRLHSLELRGAFFQEGAGAFGFVIGGATEGEERGLVGLGLAERYVPAVVDGLEAVAECSRTVGDHFGGDG